MNAEQLNAIKARIPSQDDIVDWPAVQTMGLEDVPALVAEVERLQQQLEKANGLLGWAHDVLDDVHCYETEVYQEISEYFGEDD